MYKDKTGHDWRVSIVTPAGREKYLDIFKKRIYAEMERGLVDEWQLWQNTVKQSDIDYMTKMAVENPKVKVFTIPNIENKYNFCDTLRTCEFFVNAHDDNTIYIRFDDDIVWYEQGAIKRMCEARTEHPDAFVIYPNVINSTIVSRWHQDIGALGKEAGECQGIRLDEFAYTDSKFIDLIHRTFKKHYTEGTLDAYYLPSRVFEKYENFSICSVAWWGRDKLVPSSFEESWIAWEEPEKLKRPVYFLGDTLMVHYAYHTQRDFIESQNPEHLEFYKNLTK